MLDKLTALVSTLLALSLAVERVIEILKGLLHFWPFTPQEAGNKELTRSAAIHILSAFVGGIIAGVGHIAIIGSWDTSSLLAATNLTNLLLAGLLSSGGSAFWNHVLDILKASKVKKEVEAKVAIANSESKTGDLTNYIA
jgi:hypothetical protein